MGGLDELNEFAIKGVVRDWSEHGNNENQIHILWDKALQVCDSLNHGQG